MTDLRTAALRALEALQTVFMPHHPAVIDLRAALAQPEDKSQAAFEHWVETVEATQGCAISRNAVVDATVTPAQVAHRAQRMRDAGYTRRPTLREMAEPAEPCNKSCAQGYCYCEPIIQPEIKVDKEARWLPMPWKGLTEEEHNYYKALGFVGARAVEEKLRAKNSTLACIPAVPPV
jgi:hypothetical protein